MRSYQNILYVSHGTKDETESLKQALTLVKGNNARMRVALVCPAFPQDFPEYKEKYESSLIEQVRSSIHSGAEALGLEISPTEVPIEFVTDAMPGIHVIEQVQQRHHDLVIKEADPVENNTGFKALDMDLLRKCPCAVWLCRPIAAESSAVKIAVAVDPLSQEEAAKRLSQRLLTLSDSLAEAYGASLHIVSCWNYELEERLKHNLWVKMPEEELQRKVQQVEEQHREALHALMASAELKAPHHVHTLKGGPSRKIPQFVQEQKVDILVMGTVARTGIPGFVIGNTAENVFQQLPCSLLALKPSGFVSPIKAK